MKNIPYSHQTIGKEDVEAVVRVLRSPWITQGPKVREFEDKLAHFTDSGFAVSFSSGTAALQAAYFAAGVGRGDEVITSPLTFAATANAAVWQGAKIVFADIEEETGNIDPREVEKKITKRTKVIAAVDYAGLPAKLQKLKNIARKHKLILLEDACHALGAVLNGKKIGGISDLTVFSFHPVKSITTGEGGAVATNRKDFYEKMLLFRSHGITKDAKKFKFENQGPWYHEMQELGLNYRLTDIQAALGTSQLKKLPEFIQARREIANRYEKEFSGIKDLVLPKEFPGTCSAWHLYPVRLAGRITGRRKEIFEKLRASGIGVQVHYIPVYWHPFYRLLGFKPGLCPVAEKFYQTCISLPIFPDLKTREQKFVVRTLKKILADKT